MTVRTYTATLVLATGVTAGTVQFGNTFDPVAGWTGGGVPVNGEVMAVQLRFSPTQSGGTATIATVGQGGPVQTILSYVGGTSNWFYPHINSQTSGGTNISGWYDRYPVDDNCTFVVSGGTAAGTITAKVLVKQ